MTDSLGEAGTAMCESYTAVRLTTVQGTRPVSARRDLPRVAATRLRDLFDGLARRVRVVRLEQYIGL